MRLNFYTVKTFLKAFRSFAFVLIVCVFTSTQLWGQQAKIPPGEYTIAGITVEGTEFTDKNSIVSLSGLQVGQKIKLPGEDIGNAIKKLWKQNLFGNVEVGIENIAEDKLYLQIRLAERPRIAKYTFTGISKGQADDLREKINFIRGQRFTEPKRRNAIRTIKNFFYEKGYLNTEVEVKTKPDETMANGVLVILNINKGKRVKIKSVEIEGINKLATSKLKRKLKKTKQKKFYRIFSRSKFIPANFAEDKQKMLDYMRTKGYRDARIEADTHYAIDEKNIAVKLKVYEGNQYYFRNISWTGNYKYSAGRLDTILGIKKGEVYNTALLDRRLSMDPSSTDVSSLYLDDGYLFFRADPVEVVVENDSIDLEIRIFEGPQATYNKIFVEGNTKTNDHVILREVRTLPGNKFSRSEIIRSQREILNLGFFNQEKMNVIPIPNPEKGTVDIKYVVEEKPSDQLFFQGGWGGRIRDVSGNIIGGGLIATVGLTFNNFSTQKMFNPKAWRPLPAGDGQRLSLRIQTNGEPFQQYMISFTEPWFGGKKPNSLGVTTSFQQQRYSALQYKISSFNQSFDFGTRLKFPDDFFRSFTTLRYSYMEVLNARNIFPDVSQAHSNILSIRQTFDRTSIDVPIFPTRGSSLMFSVEATPPWSLFIKKDYAALKAQQSGEQYRFLEFHKWKFNAETYTKLTNNKLPTVLFGRMMFGFLGMYNEELGMTPFERFYLGGDGLFGFNLDGREIIALRGYNTPAIGPNNGATVYNKFTFELRQPLSLAPTATVWLHAFAEGGNAWGNFNEYNPFDMKRSVGAGVRVFLPMFGLLGVDCAYGFDKVRGTYNFTHNRGVGFHFMLGQQF